MATMRAPPEQDGRKISDLAGDCQDLFLNCTSQQLSLENQSRTELQRQRFHVWASYLGLFTSDGAALDKRLEYSDEVRAMVVQLLSLMERNLYFIASAHSTAMSREVLVLSRMYGAGAIQGTDSEALDAVEGTIDRLNRLGATIRKYPIADLENGAKSVTERYADGNFSRLALKLVQSECRTAGSSLQDQLAISMANRRQRMRYVRKHQAKLVASEAAVSRPQERALEIPAPSSIIRTEQYKRALNVWSSKNSTGFLAEELESFPAPPKANASTGPPRCLFCGKHLEEWELELGRWHRHVLDDVEPFICISDNCETTSKSFGDFESWATHMSQVHSMKWTQQIHRPIRWRCDVDHAAEMFEDENAFRKHLNVEHGEYNPARREAVYSLSRVTKRRRRNICPLCNFHVTPMTAGVSQLKEVDESEQLHDLAKHIAGHLCLLAFSSAKDLDSDFDHVSGTSMKILTDPASSTKPGLPNQILDAFVMSNLGASTMLNASMKNKQISSADRPPSPGNKRCALLIGPKYENLPGTENDVREMGKLLRTFGFDSIRELCGLDATRHKIITEWESLIKDCARGDAVVIYYSGHGGMVKRPKSSTKTTDTSPLYIQYLVPSEFDHTLSKWTGIFDDELSHYLEQTTRRTENVTYILDCCHSARLGRNPPHLETRCKAEPADEKHYERILYLKGKTIPQLVDKTWSNPSVVRLSAASESDAAFQYNTGSGGWRGAMTKHLILSLQSSDQRRMSWRNIMVEVAARVRYEEMYEQKPQEPRSAGADTRIPFLMEQERTKVFSAMITQHSGSLGVDIHAGLIHGITLGCTFDLMPINHAGGAQPGHQPDQGQPTSKPLDEVTTAVSVKRLRTFFCAATFPESGTEFPFKEGTLVLARQRPRIKPPYHVRMDEDLETLESLEAAVINRNGLRISESGENFDLELLLSGGDPHKIEVQGLFDGKPRGFAQLAWRDPFEEAANYLLLVAGRFDSAKSLLELSRTQHVDELLLPAEFGMEIRKVNLDGNEQHQTLAACNWSIDTFNNLEEHRPNLRFDARDEYELVLKGLVDREHFASVFRVDAAGNIILISRSFENGVDINKYAGKTVLSRGYEGTKKRGMVLYWPPGVPAVEAVRESFVVVVTNGQADLRSLETVAARDYYDKLARTTDDRVALSKRVDKFKMVRIDYELRPLHSTKKVADRPITPEESQKLLEDSGLISPEATDAHKEIEDCLKRAIVAERGITYGFRRMFKDLPPPFVWVINAHDEEITVTVARERPLRYLKRLELQVGMTSGGTSLEFDNPQSREPGSCKKRLAPSSDSQRSRAKFPLRKDRVGVISIWVGEEMKPFIEGDDVSAGRIYLFDNTPDLRIQEADPLEMF